MFLNVKKSKILLGSVLILSLFVATLFPALFYALPNTTANNTQITSSIENDNKTPLTPTSMSMPEPDVSLNQVNISGNVHTYYDSIVEIKDAYLAGSFYILHNNSVLILENVTFIAAVDIRVYDNASLIVRNANDNTIHIDMFVYDFGSARIEDSDLSKSNVYTYDNGSAYVYNDTIYTIKVYGNSSLTLYNTTNLGTLYAYDFANIYVSNVTFHTTTILYDNVTAYFEQVTFKPHDLYVYDNVTAIVKNSTMDDIFVDKWFSKVTIINSTVDQFTSYSGLVSTIYNSTVNTIVRSFIVYGDGVFTNGILELLTGTFAYSVNNDSATHINFYFNTTNFYVMSGSLTIANQTTTVSILYGEKAVLNVLNSSGVTLIKIYRGSALSVMDTSFVPTIYAYDSSLALNSTKINTFSVENSQIDFYNITYHNAGSYITSTASTFTGSNLTIPSLTLEAQSTFLCTYLNITSDLTVRGDSLFNTTYASLNGNLIESIDSTILGMWMNLTDVTLDLYNGSMQASNLDISGISLYMENETFDMSDTQGIPGTATHIYSSIVTLANVSVGDIYLHNGTVLTVKVNSTTQNINTDLGDNSTIIIQNSTIDYLDASGTGISATATESNITRVDYYINITSGEVNITDYLIDGSTSNYYSSFVWDTATNITNLYLVFVYVYDATTYIRNQLVIGYIYTENSEVHLDNVTTEALLFDGSNLKINNSTFDGIIAGNSHSPVNVNINDTVSTYIYLGAVWTLNALMTGGNPQLAGIVSGNVTNTNTTMMLVNKGELGVSNVIIDSFGVVPFATVYLYNSTINTLYQSYVFKHDGSIYMNKATGYSSVSILNITGNSINALSIFMVANFNGTLQINASSDLMYLGYNNSIAIAVNSTSMEGFELHNNAVLYLNGSSVSPAPFVPNALWDNSKLYMNTSHVSGLSLYDSSYAEIFNSTLPSSSLSSILFTVNLYNSSRAVITNSTVNESDDGVVQVTDTAQLSARNFNVSASSSSLGLIFSKNAVVSWNLSELMFQDISDVITLYDNTQVYFGNVTVSADGTSPIDCLLTLYNSSMLTAVNFTMLDTCNGGAYIMSYDTSETQLSDANIVHIISQNNATTHLVNTIMSSLYLYDNATLSLLNNRYIPSVYGYVRLEESSTVTITNTSLQTVYLYDKSNLFLYDVDNGTSGLYMFVSDQALLAADNLTANYISFYLDMVTHPRGKSVLNNTVVDTLRIALTLHKTGSANFTGTTFDVAPSSVRFDNVEQNNVTTDDFGLYLYILDNMKVNGTNSDLKMLNVAIVSDSDAPIIAVSPASLAFEKGIPNKVVTFTITEPYPDYYILKKNVTVIMSGTFDEDKVIVIDASALSPGTWEFTLFANDTSTNSATASAVVTVYPSEPPVFTARPPQIYNMTEGSTGNVLNWTVTDRSPANYEIYVNGTLMANDTWASGDTISYNIDSLTAGNYNITIVVYDEVGNNATDTVTVAVTTPAGIPGLPIPLEYLIILIVIIIVLIVVAIYLVRKRRK